jgi:hypothetical protein
VTVNIVPSGSHLLYVGELEMAVLSNLHLEIRIAFKTCARAYSFAKTARRTLNSSPLPRARNRRNSRDVQELPATNTASDAQSSSQSPERSQVKHDTREPSRSNTTELVPRVPKPGSLEHPRRSDIPARVLPKAQLSPELTLSPKQRLQIEYMTRRPPKAAEKPG